MKNQISTTEHVPIQKRRQKTYLLIKTCIVLISLEKNLVIAPRGGWGGRGNHISHTVSYVTYNV